MAIGRPIAVLTLSDVAPVPGVQATAKVTQRGRRRAGPRWDCRACPEGPLISGRDNDASSRGKW
jgi:hypothetical protein